MLFNLVWVGGMRSYGIILFIQKLYFYAEFQPVKTRKHFVRIYMDTPTFERITKDSRTKFEDILSTIGGTLGLLTGFSLIG